MGRKIKHVFNTVTETAEAILHNPVPVIEAAILTIATDGLAEPAAAALNVTVETATAGIAAVNNAAVAAANGGKVENIAKAAIAGGVGGLASQQIPTTVGGSTTLAKVASSAVGADATATTNALLNGKNLQQSLDIGTKAAAAGALSSATSQATSAAADVVGQGASDVLAQAKQAVQPIVDVTKPIVQAAKDVLPSITKQDIQQLLPSSSSAAQVPKEVLQTFQTAGDISSNQLTSAAKQGALASFFGGSSGGQTGTTSQASQTKTSPTTTGASPGSGALAQALRLGDPTGTLFGDKEGQKKQVWNVESLRSQDTGVV